MEHSKYEHAFSSLLKKGVFTSAEGRHAGIPARMLHYLCLQNEVEKVGRGLFKVKDFENSTEFEWEDLVIIAKSIPNGTICLVSALSYYDLTEEMMREFWMAIPHSTSAPKRSTTRIVRMRNTELGRVKVKIAGVFVWIYDRERTIVDAFRYLDKEVAIKALKAYLTTSKQGKGDIKKLLRYAKKLRVNIAPYITTLTV